MAVSEAKKQKLITECNICDILKNELMPEVNKISKCGSQSKPVNYGRINQIVKQEKSKGGDAFFRTWKTICVLWKSYFGQKERKDAIEEQDEDGNRITKNQKFIVRPPYSQVKDFEIQIVKTYQKNYEDYEMLDTHLKGLERKFRDSDKRDRRKLQRIKDREWNKAKDEGASGVAAVERVRARMSEERGDGKTGDDVNTNELKEKMTECFKELHAKYNVLYNEAKARVLKSFLAEMPNIANSYIAEVGKVTRGSERLRSSAKAYLKELSTAKDAKELKLVLGASDAAKKNPDLEKLLSTIRINGKQDMETALRNLITSLYGQGM